MKNFSPETAFLFAELVSKYVDYDEIENFRKDFEEFMDSYENGTDEPDKVIHIEPKIAKDATPDEIADVVKSAFGKNPNPFKFSGEMKTVENGNKYIVVFKDEITCGGNCDAHN